MGQGSKRKERIVSGPAPFLGEGQGLPCRFPLLPFGAGVGWGWGVAHMTDDLSDVGQKVPNWRIKTIFLGKVEAAVGSGINSSFGMMGFSTSDTIWGLCFSL